MEQSSAHEAVVCTEALSNGGGAWNDGKKITRLAAVPFSIHSQENDDETGGIMIRKLGFKRLLAVLSVLALVLAACGDDADDAVSDDGIVTDIGVDVENQVISIGVLNDESGPAAAIGIPFALGKRILADQINAGGSGLLPEGWTVELVERDHGYDPSNSVSRFNEIKDDVLFFFHSFGTPNTLPLVPDLERDGIVAFPASLSSAMAENEFTPPIGSPYMVEAEQAVDWAVEDADGAENVRLAIIYQQDDYGEDGLHGAREAADHHGIDLPSSNEIEVAPGETEFTAPLSRLQDADANYVILTTLPTATIPVLQTADTLGYTPIWLGNTPAWVDLMFDLIPQDVYEDTFRWVTGLPLWGEESPGMEMFLDAYEEFGRAEGDPDFYILVSYLQGLLAIEAVNIALEAGDVTRAGYLEAVTSIEGFDADGIFAEAADLTRFPYETQTDTRVLAPGSNLEEWTVVRDWSTPQSWEGIGG
jgi:ABC-type branched-subunit amino acid transport system substrate-binding protein